MAEQLLVLKHMARLQDRDCLSVFTDSRIQSISSSRASGFVPLVTVTCLVARPPTLKACDRMGTMGPTCMELGSTKAAGPHPITCFQCGQPGHKACDCTHASAQLYVNNAQKFRTG